MMIIFAGSCVVSCTETMTYPQGYGLVAPNSGTNMVKYTETMTYPQ